MVPLCTLKLKSNRRRQLGANRIVGRQAPARQKEGIVNKVMSIDLHTGITPPLQLRKFLPRAALNLQLLLNGSETPRLTFDVLVDGRRMPAVTDELINRSSDFFQVSIEGEPETVGLLTDGESLGVIMGAQRTKLEYALGVFL